MKPAKVDSLAQNVKIQHNIYFEEMIAQWLASRQDSAKESTYAYYTYMVKNHLISLLGQLPVWDITSGVLENFLRQKQKAGKLDGTGGLSPKTMSDLRSILRQILQYTQQQGVSEISGFCIPSQHARPPAVVLPGTLMNFTKLLARCD